MRFEPLFGQILVSPVKRHTTDGGLATPTTAAELLPMCRVVAVSSSRTSDNTVVPPTVSVGELVVLKHVHTPMEIDGKMYALASEADVLGRVHDVDMRFFDEGSTRAEYDEAVAEAHRVSSLVAARSMPRRMRN